MTLADSLPSLRITNYSVKTEKHPPVRQLWTAKALKQQQWYRKNTNYELFELRFNFKASVADTPSP